MEPPDSKSDLPLVLKNITYCSIICKHDKKPRQLKEVHFSLILHCHDLTSFFLMICEFQTIDNFVTTTTVLNPPTGLQYTQKYEPVLIVYLLYQYKFICEKTSA